jgi:hypothetical protein
MPTDSSIEMKSGALSLEEIEHSSILTDPSIPTPEDFNPRHLQGVQLK